MKSIKEKAKAYDEAITLAKKMLDSTDDNYVCTYLTKEDIKGMYSRFFPELKESEDEKIRKELLNAFQESEDSIYIVLTPHKRESFIAWLEKQGKKEQDARYENLEELLDADDIYQMAMNDEMVREAKEKAVNALHEMCIGRLLGIEKQDESTDINPSEFDLRLNKLLKQFETLPKEELASSLSFYLNVVQNNGTYRESKPCEQKPDPYNGTSFEYNGHTWGMCARDYGVEIILDRELKAFISLEKSVIYPIHRRPELAPKSASKAIKEEKVDNANKIEPKDYNSIDPHFCKPADKIEPKFKVKYANSEYNVLEIKEIAGVTYYGIEDELNHIDYVLPENCEIISGYGIKKNGCSFPTKPIMFSEQKPSWSEEDENCLSTIIAEFSKCAGKSVSKDEWMRCNDFLNSLKERVLPQPKQEWKPSNEQINTLHKYAEQNNKDGSILTSLYQDLKKLRDE